MSVIKDVSSAAMPYAALAALAVGLYMFRDRIFDWFSGLVPSGEEAGQAVIAPVVGAVEHIPGKTEQHALWETEYEQPVLAEGSLLAKVLGDLFGGGGSTPTDSLTLEEHVAAGYTTPAAPAGSGMSIVDYIANQPETRESVLEYVASEKERVGQEYVGQFVSMGAEWDCYKDYSGYWCYADQGASVAGQNLSACIVRGGEWDYPTGRCIV